MHLISISYCWEKIMNKNPYAFIFLRGAYIKKCTYLKDN